MGWYWNYLFIYFSNLL